MKRDLELAKKISPDLIYSSGWIDKGYLFTCKHFRNKIPVIVGFDNKWIGSFKQQIGAKLSKLTVQKYFSNCWIPGNPQLEFASKIGFINSNILKGFYSCDYEYFKSIYLNNRESKRQKVPHRFIFIGRYYDFKGIKDLWKAFIEFQNESPNDWELWCFGNGDITPVNHPKIKHFGFIQPKEMDKYISQAGVFVLPSKFEPWGVAVHEFASAGFPLICSNEVGAADLFVSDGQNGFLFDAGNITSLKAVFKKIIAMNDDQLFLMGEKSVELAKQITPETWVDTITSVLTCGKFM